MSGQTNTTRLPGSPAQQAASDDEALDDRRVPRGGPNSADRNENALEMCARRRGGVLFRDRCGSLRCVHEGQRLKDQPPQGPYLIFESTHAVRRVRTIPPNWRTLSDADLEVLSWQR